MFLNQKMDEDIHKIFEEEFGHRLSINPHLPPNMDFSCPETMATPNSFKCDVKFETQTPTAHFASAANANSSPISLTLPMNSFGQFNGFAGLNNFNLNNFIARKDLSTADLINLNNLGSSSNLNALNLNFNNLSNLNQMNNFNNINQLNFLNKPFQMPQETHKQGKKTKKVGESKLKNSNSNSDEFAVPQLPKKVSNSKSTTKSPTSSSSPKTKDKKGIKDTKESVPVGKAKPRRRRASASSALSSSLASTAREENRWKSWSRIEEVFLIGAVMDRFFKRGSLSSTRADDSGTDDCWSYIKIKYDNAWSNYKLKTCKPIPTERSMNALSRHYKVMKARISQADMDGEDCEDFRIFFDEWEQRYNVGNCLLENCPAPPLPATKAPTKSIKKRDSKKSLKSKSSSLSPIDEAGEFRKRKVRLSVKSPADEKTPLSEAARRTSICTASSHSTTGSFVEEGGYAIRQDDELAGEYF